MRIPPFNPYIVVVIGVIGVASSAVLIKMADHVPSAIIVHYRLLFSLLILTPIIIIKFRKELLTIQRTDWIRLFIAGIFLAVHFLFWYGSLNHTSVSSSVLILTLHPIFIFIISFFLTQERFSSGTIISIIIVLFGSSIIGWGDFHFKDSGFYGNVLAIIGTIAFAIYLIVGQNTRKNLSLIPYTYIVYGISFGIIFIYNTMRQHPFIGFELKNWIIFIVLAIIPTFFGHNLFNWALRWLNASTITTASVFEPIAATIIAYFVLHESITWSQLLGGTIVIFGLFLFIISTSRKNHVTIARRVNK